MLTRTTTALLENLHDPEDEETWRAFDDRYRPILVGFARRLGLDQEDAADIAQEALTRFVASYRSGAYDRTRGRLRSWIVGIARNCVLNLWKSDARRRVERGLSAIIELPRDDELASLWDAEFEQELLRQGVAQLREESRIDERTIGAFEQLAFDGRAAADVAAGNDMTLNDVYLAKHRCLKRLRVILEDLRQLYESD